MESAQRAGNEAGASDEVIARDEIRAAIAGHLGLDPADVTDHDDLIQLGLDSIRTMKLAGAWRKRGLSINFAQLVAEPTVADWHRLLGGGDAADSAAPAAAPQAATAETTAAARPPAAAVSSAVEPRAASADVADPETVGAVDDGTPFALAPMQHAYWIGRSEGQELGAVAAHLYVEFDGSGVDSERLERAVEQLVQRHPMLRTRFLPDGTQQTLDRPGRSVWTITDLRDRDAAEAERALEELRDRKTHQLMAVEDGQVIDIALTLLPDGRTRLHLDVDMLAADAQSYRILISDLARLYHGEDLPAQTYTFRDYLTAYSGPDADRERAREWWQQRLPELPGAPELPRAQEITRRADSSPVGEVLAEARSGTAAVGVGGTVASVGGAVEPGGAVRGGKPIGGPRIGATSTAAPEMRTVRFHRWLSPEAKARTFAAAHARGVTPAMALASVFAETIGGWSAQRRFLLNLPLFHREPVHPQVDGVVGDFTSSVLLEVDVTTPATVTERAQALQRELHAAGAHSAYSGLEVLRDLGRHRGEPVLAPIVYTSAINLGELFSDQVTATFGDPVWIISQGPQVLLDAQVTEVRGGLLLNWDVRENAFPTGMVETMFARYIAAILRLSGLPADAARELAAGSVVVAQSPGDTAAEATSPGPQGDSSADAPTSAEPSGHPDPTRMPAGAAGELGGPVETAVGDSVGDTGAAISAGLMRDHTARMTAVVAPVCGLDADSATSVAPVRDTGVARPARGVDPEPVPAAVLADAAAELSAEAVALVLPAAERRAVPAESAGWDAEATVRIPVEQAVIRAQVNATSGPVSGRTLHEGFFAHATANPDAAAVIWERDGAAGAEPVVQTYRELAAEALAVAGVLRAEGVKPGDAVAVQLPKGPDQVVATLGVLAAGAVYVPIGFDQPAARRSEILRTGGVVAAVTTGDRVPEVPTIVLGAARGYAEPLAEPVFPDPEAIAYVLFTSGSTGKPKGVEVPHRAAMNTIDDLNERFEIGAGDRALALSALEFDLSVYDIFGLLSVGGAVVTVDDAQRGEPARWVELIRRHRISVLNCVPSLLDMLLTAAAAQRLGSLRMVILGGDWVDVALPSRLAAIAPACRFAGLGGATETAIHSTICEVVDARVPAEWSAVPYGTPLRNVRCRVVGPAGHDCPDWVTGELWIGGDGVAAGYRNDPERTADRFVTHEGLRWYRTGDLARYLPDGTLEFLGRADHQVKIRGYRVELGEVESALRALPGVRHAIAAVIGSAAPKLAAVVVGVDGVRLEVEALLTAAADLLPGYMIPTRIELLAELPFTSNGKPDRKAIVTLLSVEDSATEFVAPRTDLEHALADIVAAVLDREQVGVTDDFFALGGDSVLATAVVARVREWLDSPDTVVSDFFAARTVAGLAARLLKREQRNGTPGRLDAVARMYLEVAAMSDDEVLAQS
ncbi:amino acid adenylation domain-containing protein [Nocardia huaxiensis]|nr:non-ribosomal peptide synthetase [Nocardia huaxiensis]UFS95182.1 amino acid adenylation domain-containing protein [Nocardia huaxiensis]